MRSFLSFGQWAADLRAQRLRSALTILGITWGTVAVVVLLAFGAGLERQVRIGMAGMGDGIVILFGGETTKPFEGFLEGRPIRLVEDDARRIASDVAQIEMVTIEYGGRNAEARRGARQASPYITGTDQAYAEMRNIRVEPGGRFLNGPDIEDRRRVAVLGDDLKNELFGESPAVGEQVFLENAPFIVIGVMQPKTQNAAYSARDADRLFMPASTYRVLFGAANVNNIIYRPTNPALATAAKEAVTRVLARRYRFDPTDEDALWIWDTTETDGFIRAFFLGLNIFLGVVGSFTLTVGGVGVANIMYIVVRERTLEIGIKRSVGARRRHILAQFFGETFLIVAVGALLGLTISIGLVFLIGLIPIPDEIGHPVLSGKVLLATMSLLGAIAFLAGFFPARKAATLDPMDCLRQTGV